MGANVGAISQCRRGAVGPVVALRESPSLVLLQIVGVVLGYNARVGKEDVPVPREAFPPDVA